MTTTTPSVGHRAEADGLRALAILVVVLFHFGVPGFGGGFVGVDLLVVVSGYLITRNILSDMDRGRFAVGGFYVRRFRRIVPSFIATALVVLVLGFAVMPPRMLESTARSSTWALLFSSNFHFWKQGSSDFSVGRVEIEAAAVEVDRGLVVVDVSETECSLLDGLDFGVDAFGDGVGDEVLVVREDVRQMTEHHLGDLLHRLNA